jgi:hypothetical protein
VRGQYNKDDDGQLDEHERRDRQMIELLNELRVALPGVQVLFAFLLTVPFSNGFPRLDSLQRNVYFVTLLLTALSTICLIAPSAAHRIRFHKRDRAWIIESANRLAIGGLAFLAAAMTGAVLLVSDYLFDGPAVYVYTAALGIAVVALWFVRPLTRRESSGP